MKCDVCNKDRIELLTTHEGVSVCLLCEWERLNKGWTIFELWLDSEKRRKNAISNCTDNSSS